MLPGLHEHLTALHVLGLDAPKQHPGVVSRPHLVDQLPEDFDARCRSDFSVGRRPTISISSFRRRTPRSTQPVTTVPRPVIENTSSTREQERLIDRAHRQRDVTIHLRDQLHDRRHAELVAIAVQRLERATAHDRRRLARESRAA